MWWNCGLVAWESQQDAFAKFSIYILGMCYSLNMIYHFNKNHKYGLDLFCFCFFFSSVYSILQKERVKRWIHSNSLDILFSSCGHIIAINIYCWCYSRWNELDEVCNHGSWVWARCAKLRLINFSNNNPILQYFFHKLFGLNGIGVITLYSAFMWLLSSVL